MSEGNSNPNNEWVRLNVGGKIFITTKSTLSTRPDSFLACLVNGDVPSDKDDTGAFLIDRDPEHFRKILNYLRGGALIMDRNEEAMKELLCEADFYNLPQLVDEIRVAVKPVVYRIETVIVSKNRGKNRSTVYIDGSNYFYYRTIRMSDTGGYNETLNALRGHSVKLVAGPTNSIYYIYCKKESAEIWSDVQSTLRGLGYTQEKMSDINKFAENIPEDALGDTWKFTRTVRE